MSRRESRVSINARQTDALVEFENFKKKFLLANKHITKLNSTLSVRIEELNAQISTLYTENLRLRASEINLAAQLKREREKSRKIIAETESAALGLSKHLSFLRQAFCISDDPPSSSSTSSPTRATQRPLPSSDSPNSPPYPRLSRAPTVPLIYEDDEPSDPTEDEDVVQKKSPSPKRKTKTRRLSASRLPLPARISSPPPVLPNLEFSAVPSSGSGSSKRKPLRRQSGLVVRQGSPVIGAADTETVEDEDEDLAAVLNVAEEGEEQEEEEPPVIKKEKEKRKVSSKDKDKGREKDLLEVSVRRKLRDEMGGDEGKKKKLRLTDVTNSPRSRPSQAADTVVSEVELEVAHPTQRSTSSREFLSSSSALPRASSSPIDYLPTPQHSSSPPQQPTTNDMNDMELSSDPTSALISGRERRVRKSVNYAEPKLNTKMRKPDPEPGSNPNPSTSSSSRKRKSAAAVMSTARIDRAQAQQHHVIPGHEADDDGYNDDTDGGTRSSLEGPSQPRSRSTTAIITDPTKVELPVSRPASSASIDGIPTTLPLRRVNTNNKSRSYLYADDDDLSSAESEGADTEYVPSGSGKFGESKWVNVSDRNRKKGGRKEVGSRKCDDGDGDDVVETTSSRRHSSAV